MHFTDIFKTRDGLVVLAQRPNLSIVVWFVAFILGRIFPDGRFASSIAVIGFVALFIWALLELFKGVNVFRRILGFAVLVFIVLSVVFQ